MKHSHIQPVTELQDSCFAQPQAARQGKAQKSVFMTKVQDSTFAQPQVAHLGDVQGRTS